MAANSQATTRFSALYYPYSRLLSQTDLKRAILVFDRILFVDPLSKDISEHPGQYPLSNPHIEIRSGLDNPKSRFAEHAIARFSRHEPQVDAIPAWYSVADTYKSLKQHGLAELIVPQEHLQNHQEILTYSILKDYCQDVQAQMGIWGEWWDIREGREPFGWRVHTSRIPELLVSLINEEDVIAKCIKHSSNKKLDKDEMKHSLKSMQGILSVIARSKQESRHEVVLPFGIASVLILNQALLLCELLQAFPVTDDPRAHASLLTKASNVYNSTEKPVRSVLPRPSVSDLYRIQAFTLGVITRLIPDTAIECLDMEKIVKYREHNTEALQRFRTKMVEMASEITDRPWELDFQSHILRMIESKVAPEIQNLDDELRASYQKLFGSAVSQFGSALAKAIAPAIPTITVATLLGLPAGQIVLLGAASLMSGLGIVLPDLVEYWQEKRAHERNGLTFLLNFRKEYPEHF
jgi:hypothetical protein